jgi:hypothetical protein
MKDVGHDDAIQLIIRKWKVACVHNSVHTRGRKDVTGDKVGHKLSEEPRGGAELKKSGSARHSHCEPRVPLAVDLLQKGFPLDDFTAQSGRVRIIDIHALCQRVRD